MEAVRTEAAVAAGRPGGADPGTGGVGAAALPLLGLLAAHLVWGSHSYIVVNTTIRCRLTEHIARFTAIFRNLFSICDISLYSAKTKRTSYDEAKRKH